MRLFVKARLLPALETTCLLLSQSEDGSEKQDFFC